MSNCLNLPLLAKIKPIFEDPFNTRLSKDKGIKEHAIELFYENAKIRKVGVLSSLIFGAAASCIKPLSWMIWLSNNERVLK